ncbi:MAG TPA: ectonucleotide pyrophosphatase/phosphodiesterase [Gemmatimonadaceae bacterium]|nr:ectonucleotide pyrophosphatase/phosphodiesterase [Gemmatimonadaceae bacterium]
MKARQVMLSSFALLAAPALLAAEPALRPAVSASAAADSLAPAAPRGRITDHVVIISIDGLRPDAIEKFDAKTLMRLMREGSFTLSAQTILPSKTLPSHTSMLTGVDADEHGITWNTDETDEHGHVDVPTVFGLAKQRGFRTAAFFSKTKFHHLETPNSLDHIRAPKGGLDDKWPATRTLKLVEDYLESPKGDPNLLFVHVGEPDYAGHTFGWMSRVYASAVREADRAVAEIIDEANDRWGAGEYTLIVTADHGGNGRNHGSSDPRDTTIPWIVWGEGVQSGQAIPAGVRTMDTAATALWLLGVDAPGEWLGKPVAAAFGEAATIAAK